MRRLYEFTSQLAADRAVSRTAPMTWAVQGRCLAHPRQGGEHRRNDRADQRRTAQCRAHGAEAHFRVCT